MLVAGCSREASEQQIREAVDGCGASGNARVSEGVLDGESPYVVDFNTQGAGLDAQMSCVARRIEGAGLQPPTMSGGLGTRRGGKRPMDDPPKVDTSFLNETRH